MTRLSRGNEEIFPKEKFPSGLDNRGTEGKMPPRKGTPLHFVSKFEPNFGASR